MNKKQLEFTTILNDSFAQYERRIAAYIFANKEKYEGFARIITPGAYTDEEIYSRIAFAILSANAPFDDSVKALNHCIKNRGHVKPQDIIWYKMVPDKAKYVNTLSRMDLQSLLRQNGESWHDYRLRLLKIKGLGLAKASFAACLLYPLDADLACVDTWIQKVFLGNTGWKKLGIADYLLVESKIRTYANCFGISTFLTQWMTWDHARNVTSSHDIFPGGHK